METVICRRRVPWQHDPGNVDSPDATHKYIRAHSLPSEESHSPQPDTGSTYEHIHSHQRKPTVRNQTQGQHTSPFTPIRGNPQSATRHRVNIRAHSLPSEEPHSPQPDTGSTYEPIHSDQRNPHSPQPDTGSTYEHIHSHQRKTHSPQPDTGSTYEHIHSHQRNPADRSQTQGQHTSPFTPIRGNLQTAARHRVTHKYIRAHSLPSEETHSPQPDTGSTYEHIHSHQRKPADRSQTQGQHTSTFTPIRGNPQTAARHRVNIRAHSLP